MKRKVKIGTKLSAVYAGMMSIIIIVTFVLFYYYYQNQVFTETEKNLVQISDTVMAQVDSRLTNLDQVTIDILGNNTFAELWDRYQDNISLSDDDQSIRKLMVDVYKNRSDIRRVAVYSLEGKYIATGEAAPDREHVRKRSEWLLSNYNMNQATSRVYLGESVDFWDDSRDVLVVSEVKPIKNKASEITGFIEVQQNAFYIQKACTSSLNGSNLEIAVLMDDDTQEFFYSAITRSEDYMKQLTELSRQYSRIRKLDQDIVAIAMSNYFACRTIVVAKKSVFGAGLMQVMRAMVLIAVLMIVVNAVFCRRITGIIMKPLYLLVKHMENLDIHNFDRKLQIPAESMETEILVSSFERMSMRLQQSLESQKQMEAAQNKALFDALQSIMGPHFLYNTLGGIANMCEQGEAEEAADVCYSLTEILRYAADYEIMDVTLADEMDNLKSYLSIMKSRYRQRLEYELFMDEQCKYLLVPKLTYQPLVENAIKYSLTEKETVVIKVKTVYENGRVHAEIADNGCGISKDAVENIRKRLEEFKEEDKAPYMSARIQFGGLGLCGTLIRLSLFYGDRFHYEIVEKNEEGGTSIIFEFAE